MDKLFQVLGNYLLEKRKRSGLSQGQVAKALGYTSPQFISNFERGLCSPPLKKLKVLVKLYNMPGEEVAKIILGEQRADLEKKLRIKAKK